MICGTRHLPKQYFFFQNTTKKFIIWQDVFFQREAKLLEY